MNQLWVVYGDHCLRGECNRQEANWRTRTRSTHVFLSASYSCHPPELIDGNDPICASTEAPTMSPTVEFITDAPSTSSPTSKKDSPWYIDMFKSREHETASSSPTDSSLSADDDEIDEPTSRRNLGVASAGPLYQTDLDADERASIASLLDSQQHPSLPNKQCESWLPSIVPRQRTVSGTWAGASPDPSSRALSAHATSRPRKLHPSFFQSHSSVFYESPLQNSWLTSSVPINIPKYESRHISSEFKEIALDVPEMTHKSSRLYKTVVDYGDAHPFEGAANDADNVFHPLRLTFATDDLLDYPSKLAGEMNEASMTAAIAKIEAITGDILPNIAELYAGALRVVPLIDNIYPVPGSSQMDKCGAATIPRHHLNDGVPNTDTLIYVSLNGPKCSKDITAYASVCSVSIMIL